MSYEYTIKREDFTSEEMMLKLVDLQNVVYAGKHHFTSGAFKFWYIDNPNGHVLSFNAFYGDIIAAHYAVVPIKMLVNDRIVNGALSMATVTHPQHQKKGLFKTLAELTYNYAKELGYEFIIGVANANSIHGFIKYFNFKELGKLNVLMGTKNGIQPDGNKDYSVYWNEELLRWRLSKKNYTTNKNNNAVFGTTRLWKFKKAPLVKTFMGSFDTDLLHSLNIPIQNNLIRPFTMYIGLGSNARKLGYKELPKAIKHSPFHLIFLDLTEGKLPEITKDNVFFQLIDFDVA